MSIRNKKAFTLIEMLIGVLIIGILAAIAWPQYQTAVLKTRFATLMNNAHAIKNATEMYYLNNGYYPNDSVMELDIDIPGYTNGGGGNIRCNSCNIDYDLQGSPATHIDAVIGSTIGAYGGNHVIIYRLFLDRIGGYSGKKMCIANKNFQASLKVCQSVGKTQLNETTWEM
ncbi:MAG: prepilin-type N-terminal cleavage/methylation domain-containing protein [Elusimicrobiota bacterium]|nr:prepilin-type N-terminal cleavage/methylation domain-containing protein [Elusimicrobiota bacterium]